MQSRSHSFQNLLDTLAPEVEAPPADPFGLAAVKTEERRDPYARVFFRGCVILFCILGLAVILLRDAEVRSALPPPPTAAVEPLHQVQHLDPHEKCVVIRYLDAEGRERHKHTHCPGLEENGLMAWPLEVKP